MLSRREFIKLCMKATTGITLAGLLRPNILAALASGEITRTPVIWIELGSCTGESISLDNTQDPELKRLLLEMVELRYHWLFNAAQGEQALNIIYKTIQQDDGNFILVVEGSVVTRDEGHYNLIGAKNGQLITGIQLLKEIAPKAKHIMAVGACAAFGGPGAAYPNPSQAVGVQEVIKKKVINIPGCPAHTEWMLGTLAHLIMYGEPELNNYNCPTIFFGKTIHDLCPRRSDFDNGKFANYPGEEGCFYKIGCKGPVTYADCPIRQWNNHINWPIKAGTPCIGCASPHFPDGMMPYWEHLPDINLPGGKTRVEKVGATLSGLTALGITSHALGSVIAGRMGKHLIKGTQLLEPAPGERVALKEINNKEDIIEKESKEKFAQKNILNKLEEIINQQEKIQREISRLTLKKNKPLLKKLKFWQRKRDENNG